MTASDLVVLRGGFRVRLDVVLWLLDLERRGARFRRDPDGRYQVDPVSVLTDEDRAFLAEHRDEARRVLTYQPDDRSLFDDPRLAQPGHVPADEVPA